MTTLTRLSFWVPEERTAEFDIAYGKKIVPLLKKHDLVEPSLTGRPSSFGVFSRLFELETPASIPVVNKALQEDPAWQKALHDLGKAFGDCHSALPWYCGVYSTPAGSGKNVPVGSGCRQGAWQSFGVQDGLPSSIVFHIAQDQKGYLWFATNGRGVCRFDGTIFTIFTAEDGLAHNDVQAVLEDRQGYLWIGTEEGVSRYDGERFVTFTTADGLANNIIFSILEDCEGYLWFGTGGWGGKEGGGVSRFDGEKFTTFSKADGLASDTVFSILEDREGCLWFGTRAGVSRYDGTRFTTVADEGRPLVEDQKGCVWLGSKKGASCFDGQNLVPLKGLEGKPVVAGAEDEEGHLWFGTEGKGVWRYDGTSVTAFNTEDGLGGNAVTSILKDREDCLWFATFGGGVSRYDGTRCRTFTAENGLVGNRAYSLLEDRNGRLWIGTEEGVSRFDGDGFTRFTAEDGLVGDAVKPLLEDRRGRIWFGTDNGVRCFEDGRFTALDGLKGKSVSSIGEERDGRLWFGSRQGVVRSDGDGFTRFTAEDGLADDWVTSILKDRLGRMWFGTFGGGVSRYDDSGFITFTTADGLAHNQVLSLLEDRRGNLWFGTFGGGVSRYSDGDFTTFTTVDGLAGDWVISMLEDRQGNLWFGTLGGGVSRFDGQVFQSLSRKDGLAHDTVRQILQDHRGDFWIASEGGVTRYRPSGAAPAICIKDVIADLHYGEVQEISVPSSQKLITFEFQGSSLTTRPGGMAYVYRLEGCDPDWKTAYAGRVNYHELPLGEYTFQVKAVDRDLNYSEPAATKVTVMPDPRIEALTQALSANGAAGEFVGDSAALGKVQEQLAQVAETELTVLILGETGTGKGLAARTVHSFSGHQAGPFVQVSCGTIPEGLIESELFGHERGAFTGAVARKLGKVELAKGGTLFLDEIGDMALKAQVKLLRLLEERVFERVGGTKTLEADVRVIAATNRDLKRMVAVGQFREDLYFRLNAFPVRLPPLRERREDISLLSFYFMERMAAHLNKGVTRLAPEALEVLRDCHWPGNVRELEHVVQRAVIVCSGEVIQAEDLALDPGNRAAGDTPTLDEVERQHILTVLEQTGWIIKGASGSAALLGLPPSTLRSRMKKLGIARA